MILRLALILMGIAALAAGGLALLNSQTAPVIAENKRIEQEMARREVVASVGATQFEEVTTEDGFVYYRAFDDAGDLVGYATLAFGKGYSSTIETVIGLSIDYKITGLKVTFQQETPGLGTKIVEDWFLSPFAGKDGGTVAVTRDRGEIDAVTGATISSRALCNSLNDATDAIRAHATANPAGSMPSAAGSDDAMTDLDEGDEEGAVTSRNYADEEADLAPAYADEEAE